ncbi:MAG: ABC transporter ATP-binding protein [Spirochaetales bacterium]|nr:ABC transporter ATP-binding protein [Spirochaetales bacterium]
MDGAAVLRAEELTVGYQRGPKVQREVMAGISCTLSLGEMVALIGPNGIGKSTLLRTLCGLQPAQRGKVFLRNRDIREFSTQERAVELSVVLTQRVQAGSLRVFSLVGLGRYPHTPWRGALGKRDREVVEEALRMTDTLPLAHRCVSELSDGERQKVMLARALAQEPTVLVLDEPTAFLDLPRRVEIVGILKKLTREKGIAILLSTHDLDLALKTADRLWLMSEAGLSAGAPEDLVLNGTLEHTFSGHGLVFNPADGQFVLHEGHGKPVYLSGEGIEALWTRRSLEREGYSVLAGIGRPTVRVERSAEEQTFWVVEVDGSTVACRTILDMIIALRQGTPRD